MKNPFKKASMMDTLVNVGVGGAANVAIDSVVSTLDLDILKNEDKTTNTTLINAAKIALGAIGGSMVSNKYLRAATDGIATVGVSNLIAGLMADSSDDNSGAAGLPSGMIGYRRIRRAGNPAFRRHISGVAAPQNFMGK